VFVTEFGHKRELVERAADADEELAVFLVVAESPWKLENDRAQASGFVKRPKALLKGGDLVGGEVALVGEVAREKRGELEAGIVADGVKPDVGGLGTRETVEFDDVSKARHRFEGVAPDGGFSWVDETFPVRVLKTGQTDSKVWESRHGLLSPCVRLIISE
jgi:hypothetical protein